MESSVWIRLITEVGRTVRAALKGWHQTARLCLLLGVDAVAALLLKSSVHLRIA
jgi:hypothetical protein